MSNVAKTGPAAAPSPGAGRRDAGERAPKAGEFEAILRDKGQAERAAEGAGGGDPGKEGRHVSGVEERATRGSGSATPDAPAERERGEAREWRALPGDVAVPTRAPAGSAPVVDSSRAADAVARVERIAEQIVRAVEVRLGHGGSAEVRLDLDLGGLGRLRVAVGRDVEGRVAVRFDGAGPEATRLLVDRGQELVGRLEARGIVLQEVVMADADGSLVRIGSPSEPAPAELAPRLPHDAAPVGEQGSAPRPDDRDRRGRRAETPGEEEEEE